MAAVIGIHHLSLKPGVTDEQAYTMAARLTRDLSAPGVRSRVGKGDRGPQAGQYVLILEVDSVETRDGYFPLSGEASAEYSQRLAPLAGLMEQAEAVFVFPDPNFTDYVVVGE